MIFFLHICFQVNEASPASWWQDSISLIQALFLKKIQHFIASIENNNSPFFFLFNYIHTKERSCSSGWCLHRLQVLWRCDWAEVQERQRGVLHIKSAAADPPRSSFNTMPTTLRPLSRSLCRTRTRPRCTRSVCPTRKSTHQRTISPSTRVFLRLQRSSLYAHTCVCVRSSWQKSRGWQTLVFSAFSPTHQVEQTVGDTDVQELLTPPALQNPNPSSCSGIPTFPLTLILQ